MSNLLSKQEQGQQPPKAKKQVFLKQWHPIRKRNMWWVSLILIALTATLVLPPFSLVHASVIQQPPTTKNIVPNLSPVPAGFTQTQLAKGLKDPTVIAFAPNGDIYLGEQGGTILIYRSGTVLSTPVIKLNTDGSGEKGLLGLALDPSFATNGYMYVSYTTLDEHAQLSRFTVQNSVASLASEKVYAKGSQLQNGHHSANDLHVGPDGMLWWAVGDNVPSITNAQTLTNIYGKILRFNLDGTIPNSNPFAHVTGAMPAIYAYGLRNPFRFSFLPNGKVITEDTGSNYWEEFNTVQPGGNYGWDFVEGETFSSGYINPVYAYGHNPLDGAASAVAAYSGTAFPQQYNHVVFFGDYNRMDIEAVTFDSTYTTELSDTVFSNDAGTIADLQEGPDGSLYFVSIFEGTFSKISATGPFPPTAVISTSKGAGKAPLTIQFSSANSSDPYGNPLTYSWNFGDGSAASTSASPSHIFTTNGTYTVTLTVSNGSQIGTATTQIFVGHNAPTVSITSPAVGTTYNGGDTITFNGTATDEVDGAEPASAYTWQVDFYQAGFPKPFYTDEVPHPFFGPVTGVTGGTFQIPSNLPNSASTFYRITLTVTNSLGIRRVVIRDILPNQTSWTVNTNVPGTGFFVDGTWHTTAYTISDGVGIQHVLSGLADEQAVGGTKYRFYGWSDGQALTDPFTSAAPAVTYTADYEPVTNTLPGSWLSTDVGAPPFAGSVDYAAGSQTFYVDGSGADVYGSLDQFHYVYQSLNGDGTIVARVRYQTGASNPWAKAGLMIKQSTTSGSSYVDVLTTPTESPNTPNINGVNCTPDYCSSPLQPIVPAMGYGVRMQYIGSGGKSATPGSNFHSPDEWLKLQRAGNTFTSWYSVDGINWILVGSATVTMTGPVTIGLFVTSHNVLQPSTAAFDNVTIS